MASFTEQLRVFDDAELDPYQFRLLMHYWRVGSCYESIRTTAEKCGMSVGKVHELRGWLLTNGWIEYAPIQVGKRQRMALRICSLHEQCSPGEQTQQQNVHHMNKNVHHMNAILNEPLKEREEEAAALPETDAEAGAVFAAYQDNIGSLTPHISESIGEAIDELTASWVLAAIKLAAERNVRNWKYIDGILKKWRDQGHMDRPGEQSAGNGAGEAAWQRVMEQIKAGQWTLPKDGPELAAIRRTGGWPRYRESLDRDLPFLKREFLQEYHHGGH